MEHALRVRIHGLPAAVDLPPSVRFLEGIFIECFSLSSIKNRRLPVFSIVDQKLPQLCPAAATNA